MEPAVKLPLPVSGLSSNRERGLGNIRALHCPRTNGGKWLDLPQNLIGLAQVPVLALKLFDPCLLSRRLARPFAAIALDLSHPDAKAVRRTAQFTRDRRQRRSFALILIAEFHRQPNRALANLTFSRM